MVLAPSEFFFFYNELMQKETFLQTMLKYIDVHNQMKYAGMKHRDFFSINQRDVYLSHQLLLNC